MGAGDVEGGLVPLASLGLVVVAALLHATWNLLAKRAGGGAAFVFAYSLVATVAYAPWALWQIVDGGIDWSAAVLMCVVASAVLHLAYSLALQRGYQVADLSVVYPVARGTGPLLSATAAFLVLGETPTTLRLAGLGAVIFGILLIATNAEWRRLREGRGVAWGVGIGALIAAYTVVDGSGVKLLGIAPVVLDWTANTLRLAMLVPIVVAQRRREGALTIKWREAAGVGLLAPLGYILVLGAMQLGAPLSVVAPAREMSMMAGALFGMLLLGEPVGRARLAGCTVMLGGVLLLSAS